MGRRSAVEIPLPFTVESLRQILTWGATPESSPYAHLDLVEWCARFRAAGAERDTGAVDMPRGDTAGADGAPAAEEGGAQRIAREVEERWEGFLVSGWPIEALLTLDLSSVRLPEAWFAEWLQALGA